VILNDLCYLSIGEAAALFRERKLSPVELVDAYLARIGKLDPRLNCYVAVFRDRARTEALRAEWDFARGEFRGPMHGIPVALKDLFDMAGLPAGANTRVLKDRMSTQDALLVDKLRHAGAILLGKLQMHEFAMGSPLLNDPVPPARNPWDLERMPGGSSSGSAAALAAGLCAGSYGSDTGGSIRHPAAHTATVGLKPTYGLVSRRGAVALTWSMDHIGPMARRVEDTAILLQVVAGYDPADPGSAEVAIPAYRDALGGSIHGLRVGVPTAYVESLAATEVMALFAKATKALSELGAEVRDIALPSIHHAGPIFLTILLAEAVAYHEDWLSRRADQYGRDMWLRLLPGLAFSAADYVQAQRGRAMLCRQMNELMQAVDLIATPTMPRTAMTFAESAAAPPVPRSPFTRLANITGQPSISLPCGFYEGLPVGLLLTGRVFEEARVLQVADAYERATNWHHRRPNLGLN